MSTSQKKQQRKYMCMSGQDNKDRKLKLVHTLSPEQQQTQASIKPEPQLQERKAAPSSGAASKDEEDEPNVVYAVKEIMRHRYRTNSDGDAWIEYLVWWDGYNNPSEWTWETRDAFDRPNDPGPLCSYENLHGLREHALYHVTPVPDGTIFRHTIRLDRRDQGVMHYYIRHCETNQWKPREWARCKYRDQVCAYEKANELFQ